MINKAYGIVGLPGSGKSEIIKVADVPIISMGDIIREELTKKGIEITPETMGNYMLEIREKFGKDIVAKKTYNKIEKAHFHTIIIDGLRNYEEVEYFKSKIKNFYIIAILASPKTRFFRLVQRKRQDDSAEWKIFNERDNREISVGIAKVIALADYMLINEGEINLIQEEFKKLLLAEK